MRRKILSMVTVVMMLFMAVGCGGGGGGVSETNAEQTSATTKVSFTFKTLGSTNLQKLSDITKVLIDVKKDDAFIYEGKTATKVNGVWSAKLSLKKNDGPYVFDTRAYNGATLLYRGIKETTETLPERLALTLEAVTPDTSVNTLPSLENIKVYVNDNKEVRMKFTIANTKRDDVAYSFSLNEVVVPTFPPVIVPPKKAKSSKGEVDTVDIGSIAPASGTLVFGTLDEKTFNAIYTRPTVGNAKVKATLLLINEKGDEVTIPFDIPSYEEQDVVINFPPEINKIYVLDEGDKFTVSLDVNDVDSTSWTYQWSILRGVANIVGTIATEETLSLEGYHSKVSPNLCIDVRVKDDVGASTKVAYCLKGADLKSLKKTGQIKSYATDGSEVTDGSVKDDGFYQKGLTPQYTRDNTAQTVTDHITGLVWQDDESVKTNNYTWEEAKRYCENKGNGWHLPSIQELTSIIEYGGGHVMNVTFLNRVGADYWSSTSVVGHEDKMLTVSFYIGFMNDGSKSGNTVYHVRCVRDGR